MANSGAERVDIAMFDDALEKFKTAISVFDSAMATMNSQTQTLLNNWEGKGKDAFSDAYSAVYICDIEKDRRPVPDEILEKLPTLLHLNETETDEMYDLAAKSRNTVSADLPEYIMEKDIVRAALRTAKKNNVTDKQWEDFIRRITKESD